MENFEEINQPFDYKNYTITIWQDIDVQNPLEDYDGMVPMVYTTGRHNDISGDETLLDFFDNVIPTWVSHHWRKICDILDIDPVQFDKDCHDYLERGESISDYRFNQFAQELNGLKPSYYQNTSDMFDALESLYELLGWQAISTYRTGYSQGDYFYVLAVATPEFKKRMGIKGAVERIESYIDTFGAWAFGDVYGYTIEESSDSCGGFIGELWHGRNEPEPYIFEAIRESIEWGVERKRKAKQARLIELIKNHVPLAQRADELESVV